MNALRMHCFVNKLVTTLKGAISAHVTMATNLLMGPTSAKVSNVHVIIIFTIPCNNIIVPQMLMSVIHRMTASKCVTTLKVLILAAVLMVSL